MKHQTTRRHFLQNRRVNTGTVLGLGPWGALLPISPARAVDATVTPDLVQFGPDIEPIVRLVEETPREKCVAVMVEQLRKGLSYRNFLAALYLANIRTTHVSHALAELHSANELSLDLPNQERLLPLFWGALDSFKVQQQRGSKPALRPIAGPLPSVEKAEDEFHAGMKELDGERAERAVVALVRSQGVGRLAELFWHYGARDFSFIGHFPIWTVNSWRPLETVGWQHAESVLRVVTLGLCGKEKNLGGSPYPSSCERVRKAVDKLPPNWAEGGANAGLTERSAGPAA